MAETICLLPQIFFISSYLLFLYFRFEEIDLVILRTAYLLSDISFVTNCNWPGVSLIVTVQSRCNSCDLCKSASCRTACALIRCKQEIFDYHDSEPAAEPTNSSCVIWFQKIDSITKSPIFKRVKSQHKPSHAVTS